MAEPCGEGFTYIEGACVSNFCVMFDEVCWSHGTCHEVIDGTWKCYCEEGRSGQWCELYF